MSWNGLRPRAIAALGVVAFSLFLLLSFASYGPAEAGNLLDGPGPAGQVAAWFISLCGAGAYVLALLPLTWGVIVFFQERTPDLVLRGAGTALLAFSTATLVGLAQDGQDGLWSGHLGSAAASALVDAGPLAKGLGWAAALALFTASLIFATDWLFHTVRRGSDRAAGAVPAEPRPALREAQEAVEREFVHLESRAEQAALEMAERTVAPDPEPAADELPRGFTSRKVEGRTVLRGPVGYRGIEFLPPSDELASPDEPLPQVLPSMGRAASGPEGPMLLEDVELFLPVADVETEAAAASETFEDPVEEPFEETVEDPVEAAIEAPAVEPEPEPVAEQPAYLLDDVLFIDPVLSADPEPVAAAPEPAAASAPAPGAADEVPPAPNAAPQAAREPESGPGLFDDLVIEDLHVVFDPGTASVTEAEPEPVTALVSAPEPTPEAPPPVPEREVPTTVALEDTAELEQEPAAEQAAPEDLSPVLPFDEEPVRPAPAAVEPDLRRLHSMYLDPLFRDAVATVLDRGRASAVVLQRQLGIGHGRSLRILDQMTEAGLLGPDAPSGARDIRVSRAAWDAFVG